MHNTSFNATHLSFSLSRVQDERLLMADVFIEDTEWGRNGTSVCVQKGELFIFIPEVIVMV